MAHSLLSNRDDSTIPCRERQSAEKRKRVNREKRERTRKKKRKETLDRIYRMEDQKGKAGQNLGWKNDADPDLAL